MFKEESTAFLFNLTRSCHFPSKATGKDIFCDSNWGPYFSGDDGYSPDFSAWRQPFNGKDNCYSRSNRKGYNIPLETIKKGWFSDPIKIN